MPYKAKILIVDDEPIKRVVMQDQLTEEGFTVDAYDNPLDANEALINNKYDVILTDIRMPGLDGISFLKKIKKNNPNQAVIVMTAFGTIDSAIEAMKFGAYDYLQKPFGTEALILKLDRLLNYKNIVKENHTLKKQLGYYRAGTKFIGKSAPIRNILSKIHTLSSVDSNVLIRGNTGTGKECIARLIHESSVRTNGPFIAVSCASLPKELIEAELFGHVEGAFTGASKQRAGRFELANNGTIFLDDIDDFPLELQVKLLRVIQEREFERIGSEKTINIDFRLVTATKKNLTLMVENGLFREDLYFRLNIIPLHLPPLCDRKDDIPLLCEYFINRFSISLNHSNATVDEEVIKKLTNYSWPGNVRELENIIERMLVLSKDGHVTIDHLPKEIFEPDTSSVTIRTDYIDQIALPQTITDIECKLVQWALVKAQGNLTKAASLLSIPRSSLQYKISKCNISH